MSHHSEDLREEEDDNVIDTRRSILSNIMGPIFSDSNSHIDLLSSSSFLNPPFILRRKSMRLIDESIKGYIQRLLLTWKNKEQPLDFIPLEKAQEDYYPEEIEEEVILSHYASHVPASIQRKVTSYASNAAQGTEVHAIDNNNAEEEEGDYSFSKYLPKAPLRKSAISHERDRYESTREKKSLKNPTIKEDDDQSSKREAKSPTQAKKYSVGKGAEDFKTENVTSFRMDSSSKIKSPFKAHSDMPHVDHVESTQVTPGIDLSQDKKKKMMKEMSSSSPQNEYAISSPLNKQQEPYEPPKINKSLSNDKNTSSADRQSQMENYKFNKIQGTTKYTSQNGLSYGSEESLPDLSERGPVLKKAIINHEKLRQKQILEVSKIILLHLAKVLATIMTALLYRRNRIRVIIL